jgi:hypothetical protein
MSFWNKLFGRGSDHINAPQLSAILETAYKRLYSLKDDPEAVEYYARFACEIAVSIRDIVGIDIGAIPPQFAKSHSFNNALAALQGLIDDLLKGISTLSKDDPRSVHSTTMMQAATIWRGYLLALTTPPPSWGIDAVCALSALAILATASPAQVINRLRDDQAFVPSTRKNVRDDDWPPRGCVNLILQNGPLLSAKTDENFGTLGKSLLSRNELDAMKQTGREETARRRTAVEQRPRASLAEIGIKAAQYSPMHVGPDSIYNTMRRDDFCDVVLTALRAGTLSETEATLAVYTREWVVSGSDLRTSFPEWLEAEGPQAMSSLSQEWLRSEASQRTPFNDWYATRAPAPWHRPA